MNRFITWFETLKVQKKLQYSFGLLVMLVLLQGVIGLFFLNKIGGEGEKAAKELAALADAAMEIKLSATTAHLLFEEIMAGDEGEDINEVWQLLDETAWYSKAIIEGGIRGDVTIYPSQSSTVKNKIHQVIAEVDDFIRAARMRYEQHEGNQGVGTDADEAFDQQYEYLVKDADFWLKEVGENNIQAAVMIGEYRFRLANGHLLVAEILGGDNSESFEEALGNFQKAKELANAVARLGSRRAGQSASKLNELMTLANSRYGKSRLNNSAGSESDVAFDQAFEKFIEISEEAEQLIQDEIDATEASLRKNTEAALLMLTSGGIIGVVIAIWLSFLNKNHVVEPLVRISNQVGGIASGKLAIDTSIWGTHRTDDLGDIAKASDRFRLSVIERTENERKMAEERRQFEIKQQKETEERQRVKAEEVARFRRQEEEAERVAQLDKQERIEREAQEREQAQRREEQARLEAEERLANSVKEIAQAAINGRLTVRIQSTESKGARAQMERSINQMMQTLESTLSDFSEALDRLSQGDLSIKMQGSYKGVFDDLKTAFNQTVENLSSLVTDISQSAEAVAASSDELKSGNLDLSERVEEQATALEDIVTSMGHILESIQDNSKKAKNAQSLSENAVKQAEQGNAILNESLDAMEQIAGSSKKISDIISVIDEIAFQTNLLALNASVEAARAGEKGRGFAVVASEVRKLAQRSAESARMIKALILDSADKVSNGNQLVIKSAESMTELMSVVNQSKQWMQEINAASTTQHHNVMDVNRSISKLDEFTAQNAALVEEASASSESMSGEAQRLNQMVSSFQLSS